MPSLIHYKNKSLDDVFLELVIAAVFTFKIKSDAPEEKLRELVELAQKRSPVFDIVSHPTPVEVSMEKKQ